MSPIKQAENKPKNYFIEHRRVACVVFSFLSYQQRKWAQCACVCACVSVYVCLRVVVVCFHLSLTCWLCVASGSLVREFSLRSLALFATLSVSPYCWQNVCVCVCLALTSALRSFAVAFAFACAIRLKATIARGCLRPVSLSRVYRISLVPRLAKLSSKFASLENWQNKNNNCEKKEKSEWSLWQTWPNYLGNYSAIYDLFVSIRIIIETGFISSPSECMIHARTGLDSPLPLTRASFGHKFRVDSRRFRSLPRNFCCCVYFSNKQHSKLTQRRNKSKSAKKRLKTKH